MSFPKENHPMSLPDTITYSSNVDSYISDIGKAFRAMRNDLTAERPSGTLTLTLDFPLRMDGDAGVPPVPVIKLVFYHHYVWDDNAITVKGLEFKEVRDELFRRLGRDSNLKRIANMKGAE
jgi:hypothetical protein